MGDVDIMSRSELLEVFKKFIMPKPQRQKKSCGGKRSNVEEKCNGLVQEVRNIKLNRSISETYRQSMSTITTISDSNGPMDCSPSYSSNKRSINESIKDNSVKRQRIQWP